MSQAIEAKLVLEMRDAMVALQAAAGSADMKGSSVAIKSCWAAAKRFFVGDQESLASFRQRMEGIRDSLKTNNYDGAVQIAEQVRQQLQQLALLLASQGELPELLEELQETLAEMTPFEHHINDLCEKTYRDDESPERVLAGGMFSILENALMAELSDGETPMALLATHAEKDSEAAAEIRFAHDVVDQLLRNEASQELKDAARSAKQPRMVILVARLLQVFTRMHRRPPGIMPPGYYRAVGGFIFAVGLQIAAINPAIGRELVNEMRAR